MRIVIAEDLTLLREGLTRLLRDRGWEIVAAVDTGPALVDAIVEHRPDLALVDVRLPPIVHRRGRARGDRGARARARHAGADPLPVRRGELRRRPAGQRGAAASATCSRTASPTCASSPSRSQRVAGGGTAMDPEVVAQLLGRRDNRGPLAELTPRERRGAHADGRGPLQHRHRDRAGDLGQRDREARQAGVHEARPAALGQRPPARPRGAQVSRALAAALAPRTRSTQRERVDRARRPCPRSWPATIASVQPLKRMSSTSRPAPGGARGGDRERAAHVGDLLRASWPSRAAAGRRRPAASTGANGSPRPLGERAPEVRAPARRCGATGSRRPTRGRHAPARAPPRPPRRPARRRSGPRCRPARTSGSQPPSPSRASARPSSARTPSGILRIAPVGVGRHLLDLEHERARAQVQRRLAHERRVERPVVARPGADRAAPAVLPARGRRAPPAARASGSARRRRTAAIAACSRRRSAVMRS